MSRACQASSPQRTAMATAGMSAASTAVRRNWKFRPYVKFTTLGVAAMSSRFLQSLWVNGVLKWTSNAGFTHHNGIIRKFGEA